jgi:hypothetical protein
LSPPAIPRWPDCADSRRRAARQKPDDIQILKPASRASAGLGSGQARGSTVKRKAEAGT